MTTDNMPPPTIPAKPLGMTGLPLAEDWARYYTTEGRSPPRGFSKPLWDEAAMRAYAEQQTAKLVWAKDSLVGDVERLTQQTAELRTEAQRIVLSVEVGENQGVALDALRRAAYLLGVWRTDREDDAIRDGQRRKPA